MARRRERRRGGNGWGGGAGQDVSQLVDLCRQSLVFRRPADLVACLAALAGDSEAALLRVKNRLDPRDDAAGSAGYRDVAVNLRVDSDEARQLGVEGHVCEVQLLLLPFAEIKVGAATEGTGGAAGRCGDTRSRTACVSASASASIGVCVGDRLSVCLCSPVRDISGWTGPMGNGGGWCAFMRACVRVSVRACARTRV